MTGTFSGMMSDKRSSKEAGYAAGDGVYSHPAYMALNETHSQLHVARTMIDTALKAIPDTQTKMVAIQHLHTASMWLDQARAEGETALLKVLREAEKKQDEEAKRAAIHTGHSADYAINEKPAMKP